MKTTMGLVVLVLGAFGGLAVLGGSIGVAQDEKIEGEDLGAAVFGLIFVGVLSLALAIVGWRMFRSNSRRRERERERIVVQVASMHGGRFTLARLVADSMMSFDEALDVVRRMERRNLIERDVEEGTEIFRVTGL